MRQTKSNPLPTFVEVKRAVVYCRVSTDEQEANTSLDNQLKKSLGYAESLDMQVVAIFREDYTGTTLDRPELNKARAMFQNGQADALIVYNPSRLDRSKYGVNTLILIVELQQLGVELHYSELGRQVDLNDHMDVFVYGSLGGWQAGKDRDDTVKKLHDGRLNKVASGSAMAHRHPPYGYEQVQGFEGKRIVWDLVIYEPEARIVRLIYEWFMFGDESGKPLSIGEIIDKLEEMQVPTRGDSDPTQNKKAGYAQWGKSVIRSILFSETYVGTWHYRKDQKTRKVTEDSIAVEIPPIVNRELWKLVQERREQNQKRSNRRKYDYLLSGRATCGCCGYSMEGQFNKYTSKRTGKTKITLYYACPSRQKTRRRDCDLPYFRADKVEDVLWVWLTELFAEENSEKLKMGMLKYQEAQAEKVSPLQRELELIAIQIAERTAEWEQLVKDHKEVKGRRHKARIELDIEMNERQLDELETKQEKAQAELEEKTITDEQILAFEPFAAQVRADWETISKDFDSRRMLIERLNIRVRMFVEDGIRKVKVSGRIIPNEKTLLVEDTSLENRISRFIRSMQSLALTCNVGSMP